MRPKSSLLHNIKSGPLVRRGKVTQHGNDLTGKGDVVRLAHFHLMRGDSPNGFVQIKLRPFGPYCGKTVHPSNHG